MYILYTDASVQSDGAGIGWHIQTWADGQGALLKTVDKGYDYLSDNYTSMQAELLAMTRGVKEVLRHGERKYIRIRSDCKPLVRKVNEKEDLTESGKYIEALHSLLEFIDDWEVTWVEREKNGCADKQAHVAVDQNA